METLFQQYPWLDGLLMGFTALSWKNAASWLTGVCFIFLAVKKDIEPALFLSMGFGIVLGNIPYSSAISSYFGEEGFLYVLYQLGIVNEIFPLLLLMIIGASCDFSELIRRPALLLLAIAAQLGVFVALIGAALYGLSFDYAVITSVVGTIDGPSAIYAGSRHIRALLGPLAVTVYLCIALIPLLQLPVIRGLTTPSERRIKMAGAKQQPVSRAVRIVFPIAVVLVAGLVTPVSVAIVGSLMFGNILRESGIMKNLAQTGQNNAFNLLMFFMGLTIGSTVGVDNLFTEESAVVMSLGLVALVVDTAAGVLFAKFMNVFSKTKINPIVGACGISASPMTAYVAAKLALKDDPENNIMSQALGVNAAGRIVSVITIGLVLSLLPVLSK